MTLRAQTIEQFLVELSAKQPTPGGGAVAALTGATAAALAQMVVAYSFTKKLTDHHDDLKDASDRLTRARALLLTLADEDAAAYEMLAAAMKLPRDDPARAKRLPAAALAAIQVPLSVMAATSDILRLLATLTDRTNKNLRSDLAIAAVLADTACDAALHNVSVNLPLIPNDKTAKALSDESARTRETAQQQRRAIENACR